MLFSTSIQQNHPSNIFLASNQTQITPILKSPSISSYPQKPNHRKIKPIKISGSSSPLTLEPSILNDTNQTKEKIVVKPIEKPRLVLKIIWMEKNIGLALDQMIPGYGAVPLSTYHFWPRKDAWEELKVFLESKPWVSNKQMVVLLNQATDIINLWQQSGGDLA